jgi:ABC-type antimicrobial peptide transport system permease subunit
MSQVSGSYFAILGLRLRAGRTFEPHDRAGGARVVIVDEELARTLLGGGNTIGSRLEIPDLGVNAEVIGVVSAVWQAGRFGERLPQIYLPFDQLPLSRLTVLVKGGDPPAAGVTPELFRRVLLETNPTATATRLVPLEAQLGDELRRPRFYAATLAIIAVLAIVVSAGAVYASVAAAVARRTREIGIRIALGASREQVFELVLARVGAVILAGTAAGSVTTLALVGLVAARVSMDRPSLLLFVVSNVFVWVAAGLAVLRPVARATRISPVLALTE